MFLDNSALLNGLNHYLVYFVFERLIVNLNMYFLNDDFVGVAVVVA